MCDPFLKRKRDLSSEEMNGPVAECYSWGSGVNRPIVAVDLLMKFADINKNS